jgi:hypothetical protein
MIHVKFFRKESTVSLMMYSLNFSNLVFIGWFLIIGNNQIMMQKKGIRRNLKYIKYILW